MERLAVNIREAARLTSLSVHTLRSYSRTGRIATVRVGRRVLFPLAELQRLVQEGVPPQEDAEPVEATKCSA